MRSRSLTGELTWPETDEDKECINRKTAERVGIAVFGDAHKMWKMWEQATPTGLPGCSSMKVEGVHIWFMPPGVKTPSGDYEYGRTIFLPERRKLSDRCKRG